MKKRNEEKKEDIFPGAEEVKRSDVPPHIRKMIEGKSWLEKLMDKLFRRS